MTLAKRVEELEGAVGAEDPDGIWLFWGGRRAGAGSLSPTGDGPPFRPIPELGDDEASRLLTEWAVSASFRSGDAYFVHYDNGLEDPTRLEWALSVSPPFLPRWTKGAQFVPMSEIRRVKAAYHGA